MSAPTYVGVYSAQGADGHGTLTATIPNVQEDDWIIAGYFESYGSATKTLAGTGAGSWTLLGTAVGGSPIKHATYRKIATGSGTYTATLASGNAATLLVIHMRDVSSAVATSGTVASGANSPVVVGSVTPTTADSFQICLYALVTFAGARTWNTLSGFTARLGVSSSDNFVVSGLSTRQLASGSATGTASFATNTATTGDGEAWTNIAVAGPTATPHDLTDSGAGDQTVTVDKTDIKPTVTDAGTGSDSATVFAEFDALTDAGTGEDTITIDQLVDVVVTDSGAGTDTIEVADFIGNDLTEAGAGDDVVTVERTNFVDLTDSGVGVDALLLQQTRNVIDAGIGVDVLSGLSSGALTDTGVGDDVITVKDIPFTQVLPLRQLTVYDVVVVARVPQVSGPPVYLEVDPIEWKSLSYVNTLSEPQELSATCQLTSVPESILQRLRKLHELATEVWLYRDGSLAFAGPIQGFQTSGETLTIKAKGLLAYLDMMLVQADRTFTNTDQSAIVKALVDQWQALEYGHFGIDTTNVGPSGITRTETYLRNELPWVGKIVTELGKAADGFDIEVDPASRQLQLWSPVKGIDRSSGEDAIVLDQTNITSGDIVCSVTPADLASEAYGTATSSGSDTTLFSLQSNVELRSRYGRTAYAATWSDTSTQAALDSLTLAAVSARDTALIIPGPKVRVTPDADLSDYEVGDVIAYELGGQIGVSGAFRIRRTTVTASPTGQETVDLEFV